MTRKLTVRQCKALGLLWSHALIFCVLFGGTAHAQTVTDVELQAAYCLGVTTAQYEEDKVNPGDLNKRVTALINERRLRFRDYLVAKGFLAGRDANPMKLALARGPKDVETCFKEKMKHRLSGIAPYNVKE